MASDGNVTTRPGSARASISHPTSHTSIETSSIKSPRRANTFQNSTPTGKENIHDTSVFDTSEQPDNDDPEIEITRASIELDVLPIEIVTLTDTFIESLTAPIHSAPPSMDKLSQLFQDFYHQASSHINTHISALSSRHNRDVSPAPSISSLASAASRLRTLSTAKEKPKPGGEQQLITSDELAGRRQARKALETKRNMLQEAVERRLCEGIYDKIYRHKSTQDEAQDDSLRSKTAALALVNIGPNDLGIGFGDEGNDEEENGDGGAGSGSDLKIQLEQARKDLLQMHESRYPLGKLNHLKAAHKSIVDAIAHFQPSASADEIMPVLIYTLITLPPEDLHVISDLNFIQNFRWEPKLTGEAAYCLTNLEATISFLQTVDLTTLRSDELLSGPPKGIPSVKPETFPPAYPQGLVTTRATTNVEMTKDNSATSNPEISSTTLKAQSAPLGNRRLSDLVNTPAQAFGAASGAVFTTADQGLKTVTNSLGDSYNFLIGKLHERQNGPQESINVPRTLDDARKLVSTPPPEDDDDASSALDPEDDVKPRRPSGREDRVMNLIGGRRDRSADSTVSGRSVSSSKFRGFFGDDKASPSAAASTSSQNPAMLDQVRSLGTSFNPMARIPNPIGMIRGFGRTTTPAVTTTPASTDLSQVSDGGDLATAFPDIASSLPPKPSPPKIPPPNKRFMELQTPGDLKLGEVLDLLRDYRRLAGALQKLDAFEK